MLLKGHSKNRLIVLIILLILLIIAYIGLIHYNDESLKEYDKRVLPNTYIEEFDISEYTYENVVERIEYSKDYILDKKIKLNVNSKEYEYSLKDLGIDVDIKSIVNKIKEKQKGMNYNSKLMLINGTDKNQFSFIYIIDDNKLRETLNTLKSVVDYGAINGYFDDSNGVSYKEGINGYSLNVDTSLENIHSNILNGISNDTNIDLSGDVIAAFNNESYKTIDTLTSQSITPFRPYTYLRNINLDTALAYINGTVVEPGEIFSYCDVAGPFNKRGYVFYYEFVGNGVCQIATTTYNAALLGGLEIVKRYPHAKKSLYIEGGLDATVASYSSGWCADMQFRNTYQYPIYIKAFSENGNAHVEFWSNHDAKNGLEYTTSSVQIGQRGYRTYLHTWKDGVEIAVNEIATTWYTED